MKLPTIPREVRRRAATLAWLMCLCAFSASTEQAVFSARTGDKLLTATVGVYDVQGVPYVSLAEAARGFGSRVGKTGPRVIVDMGGRSAMATVNDNRVSTADETFFLQSPLIQHDGDVLIAAADLQPFFSQAFGLEFPRLPEDTSPPAETGELAVRELDELEELDGLEEPGLAPPPIPARPADEPSPMAPDLPEAPPPVATPLPGRFQTVVIDAGHGGHDTGTVLVPEQEEKSLALDVAMRVRQRLKEQTDLRVVTTRTDDRNIPTKARAKIAAKDKGDVLVSIHTGAGFSAEAQGFEVFYPKTGHVATPQSRLSRRLAENVAAALAGQVTLPARGVRGLPLRVFRGTALPGIVVEIGFLSNEAEAAQLDNERYRDTLAQGIATGIARALGAVPGEGP